MSASPFDTTSNTSSGPTSSLALYKRMRSLPSLALTNRGAGTTAQLVALAREIAAGVREAFGVELEPEPVFVGHSWR